MKNLVTNNLVNSIKIILDDAQKNVYRAVNFAMVEAYWNVGRLIVEDEQGGKERAEYGKGLIKELSARLTEEYGKGFDVSNLKNIRQFYLCFAKSDTLCSLLQNDAVQGDIKSDTVCPVFIRELSWSHYRTLIRVENVKAREWYMNEAAEQNWSVRALQRQINSFYYERLFSSKEKKSISAEAGKNTSSLKLTTEDMIKDPYILDFLNLKDHSDYHESELEQALMDKLQDFLMELGKGFAFVARQKRISTDTKYFYIDLVFYNYILNCFVLIDLKTTELTHQDVGQMDMYVRMYDDLEKGENDNPTVGVILCSEKDETIVKYSVLSENKKLFASKYLLYLPTEEELKQELERERQLMELEYSGNYRKTCRYTDDG